MINEKELSLEELDKVTAGYPDLSKIDVPQQENLKENKEENDLSKPRHIEETENLINSFEYGELSEDDLDNIMGGITR